MSPQYLQDCEQMLYEKELQLPRRSFINSQRFVPFVSLSYTINNFY